MLNTHYFAHATTGRNFRRIGHVQPHVGGIHRLRFCARMLEV